jgi:hypothetical protein
VSGKNIEEGIFLYNFQPAIGRCVGITSAEDPDRLLVFLDDDPQGEVRGGFHMTSFKLPPAAGAGLSRKGFDGTASIQPPATLGVLSRCLKRGPFEAAPFPWSV